MALLLILRSRCRQRTSLDRNVRTCKVASQAYTIIFWAATLMCPMHKIFGTIPSDHPHRERILSFSSIFATTILRQFSIYFHKFVPVNLMRHVATGTIAAAIAAVAVAAVYCSLIIDAHAWALRCHYLWSRRLSLHLVLLCQPPSAA